MFHGFKIALTFMFDGFKIALTVTELKLYKSTIRLDERFSSVSCL